MFRIVSAAMAAMVLATPAFAQSPRELSGGKWSCRMTSLTGEPGADVKFEFGRTGSLAGEFHMELPDGDDVITFQVSVAGAWTLDGAAINMTVSDSDISGAWLNGEELPASAMEDIKTALDDELTSFAGTSTVAYIAKHAMVLEEDETSISCWR